MACEAIARASSSQQFIHDALNTNRPGEAALQAQLDKTRVEAVMAEETPDIVCMKWTMYFPFTGNESAIQDASVHNGIDAIRRMAKLIHSGSRE
eukprot:m.422544 g.422544  ORF g.422544 m.422544 type:complete len:94 (-) comp21329_c1_seq4:402-683(-)